MFKQLPILGIALFLFGAITLSAQETLVVVNSPANIAGSFGFTSSFGADNWGVNPSTGTWTADVAIADDQVSPNTDACTPVMNAAELAGKIAIVDRGTCNFSLKAYHAQEAGAIAVIVVNNTPGAGLFNMLAGDSATAVVVPVVFITYEDGQLVKDELANGPVNMTIGSVKFDNNIGVDNTGVLRAATGVMPADQAEADAIPVELGTIVVNKGLNDASNVTLKGKIDFTPLGGGSSTNVYEETASSLLIEADSAELIALPAFTPTDGAGTYTITYEVTSDNGDQLTTDNEISTSFVLSEDVYTKGRWDEANNRPANTNSYTGVGVTSIEFLSGFRMPLGDGYSLDSIIFFVSTSAQDMATVGASSITAYVYEWDDADGDGNTANDEITIVGFSEITDFPDPTATSAWIRIPVLDWDNDFMEGYPVPGDDKVYYIGVRYQGPETVFFGFDETYDNSVYADFIAPTLADLPYVWVDTWDDLKPDIEGDASVFTDFWGSCSTALKIGQTSNIGEVNPEIGSFSIYPNPVSDFVNVETAFAKQFDKIDYTVVNNSGSVVATISRELTSMQDNARIDVSNLPAGQYYLNVNTVEGSVSKAFSVQR